MRPLGSHIHIAPMGLHYRQHMTRARPRAVFIRLLALTLMGGFVSREAGAQGLAPSSRRPFHIPHYNARLEPNISEKTVKGHVVIALVITAENHTSIELDSGAL